MSHRNEESIAEFLNAHQVGDELAGTVDSLVSFGAFIEVADGVHGLLHVAEYRDPPEPGERVRVRIVAMDPEAGRFSLRPV